MTDLAVITSTSALVANEAQILHWCEQGREALIRAVSLTDASDVLSVASTLEHAVKVKASSEDAVIAASSLRVAAERRVGELVKAEREAQRLAGRGGDRRSHLRSVKPVDPEFEVETPKTLADYGISHEQAADYAKLAAVDEATFSAALDRAERSARDRDVCISRAAILRELNPEAEKRPDQRAEDFEKFIDACERALERSTAAYNTVLFKHHVNEVNPWPEATVNHAVRVTSQLMEAIRKIDKELLR